MKFIILTVLSFLPLCQAEDWIVKGKTYQDVKVIKVEADAVTILDSDGGGLINLSDLNPQLQKRFSYDPVTAKAASDKRKSNDAQNDYDLETEKQQSSLIKQEELIREDADARKEMKRYAIENQSHYSSDMTARREGASDVASGVTHDSSFYPHALIQDKVAEASTMPLSDAIAAREAALADKKMAAETATLRLKLFDQMMPMLTTSFSKDQIATFKKYFLQGEICVGMPDYLVEGAWGEPTSTTTSTSTFGETKLLNYGNFSSLVDISDGVVASIEQTK